MSLDAIRLKRNRVNVIFVQNNNRNTNVIVKNECRFTGANGDKEVITYIWQTGKCMTNMLSCDNQKQMYYSHLTCNH